MIRPKLNILLAENDRDHAELMQKFLILANHNVTCLHDGYHAMCALETKTFDLIVSNIFLPAIDGIEIAKNVGNLNKNTPIFLLIEKLPNEEIKERLLKIASNHQLRLVEKSLIVPNLLREIDLVFSGLDP